MALWIWPIIEGAVTAGEALLVRQGVMTAARTGAQVLARDTTGLVVGGATLATGTAITLHQQQKKPSPDPDPAPKPLPIAPPWFPSASDEQTCQGTLHQRYEQDQASSLAVFRRRFDALPEADRQVILKHLCETKAKENVNNHAVSLDDLWSDPRMVKMLHALHDTKAPSR